MTCFNFTGRAQYFVSRNQISIWPFGTRQHFFVVDKSNRAKDLFARINRNLSLIAQFKVCPIKGAPTQRRKLVCVEEVNKPHFEQF